MNASPNSIRILSCDDHPLFRQGIAALLATQADMSLVEKTRFSSFARIARILP